MKDMKDLFGIIVFSWMRPSVEMRCRKMIYRNRCIFNWWHVPEANCAYGPLFIGNVFLRPTWKANYPLVTT